MARRTGMFRFFLPLGELMLFRFQVPGAMLAVARLTVNATLFFRFLRLSCDLPQSGKDPSFD